MTETMNQLLLNLHWHLNRLAVSRGATLFGVSCVGDGFEETITCKGRTWHRRTGTHRWQPMKPLQGNLPT